MYINYNDKLANLKAEIDMNMVPNIQHAGGSPKYCFGDLVTIGYAQKLAEGRMPDMNIGFRKDHLHLQLSQDLA